MNDARTLERRCRKDGLQMKTAHEIRGEALALSASERASLAHDLILSLDEPSSSELSPAQEEEIQRRLQSVKEGTAVARPADEVLSEIRAKYL